jgi:hypothetical protein
MFSKTRVAVRELALPGGVTITSGSAAPDEDTSSGGKGSLYIATDEPGLYINSGTREKPTWTKV